MKNRIVCLLLALVMVVGSVAVLASCGEEPPVACTNHVDANHDGKCDTADCGASVAVNHVDKNQDSYCDGCGAAMPKAPSDNDCDHYDDNGDGKCDDCDEPMDLGCDEGYHVDPMTVLK